MPSIDSFRPPLRRSLASLTLSPGLCDELVDHLKPLFATPAPAKGKLIDPVIGPSTKAEPGARYYIVNDDDLDVLKEVTAALVDVVRGESINAIAGLIRCLFLYRKKRVGVSEGAGKLALALRRVGDGGATEAELGGLIAGESLDSSEVSRLLKELVDSGMRKGTLELSSAGFVELRSDGRWYACNI